MERTRSLCVLAATAALLIGAAPPPALAAAPLYDFTWVTRWRVDEHVRQLADVNGDGHDDIVGFGDAGVRVSYSGAAGTFGTPVLVVRNFGAAQGWRNDRHVRTADDVDGDGRADLVGFGDAGVWVSYAQPDGSLTAPALKVRDFGWNQGWRVERHPRELAHLAGDGAADVVGFGEAGTYVSFFSALGDTFTGASLAIADFGERQGWRGAQYPRELGDVDGDGRADVVGFGHRGVSVSYTAADRSLTPAQRKLDDFGHLQGWRGDRHLRTLGDLDGDGIQDLVGFGETAMHTAFGRPGRTFEPTFPMGFFGYDDGWRIERHPRLLGRVNDDRLDDVVGFGEFAVHTSLSAVPVPVP